MHSILFVASFPANRMEWGEFTNHADNQLKGAKDALRLSENVWLVNMKTHPAALAWLVALADRQKLVYGLLAFEHAPE